jgi:hypothetical protein
MKMLYTTLAALAVASLTIACVQMPTERASVVDTRPQISFRVIGEVDSLRVFIDGLDMGPVANYLDGGPEEPGHALKILPGSHLLTVESEGNVIHEEKLYVGDEVSKVIQIP